ncbi:FGGY carbohydrate kinase domain-containing protein [Palaemon carinicauda]|uniref:FGGY carbohydrate kinase domain-containing protein n=1 Tax=Palaemon carinicauda TaxID=392227 RepID=UPI0035B60602
MMAEHYYIGVDVGTGSVRAALVTTDGTIVKIETKSISINSCKTGFYEQDSGEIWQAVCHCVKGVTSDLSEKEKVHGIGFDATCSLVVLDENLRPVTVNPDVGDDRHNIIMWMDHRAKDEADEINSQKHKVLKYVGSRISLEMQIPKLLWLKKHMPKTWSRAAYFLDLPDFLTMKASGKLSRSLCSVVCKWTYIYDGETEGWDANFFKALGLEDLALNNWERIGSLILPPGSKCGMMTSEAASQLGLSTETAVATSLIDAHAGGLALVAAGAKDGEDLYGRLGLICGTSTCHMCVSKQPLFVKGVWGPYYSAMVPGGWLNEGGQSATGSLIDHVIQSHPASAKCSHGDIYLWLEGILKELAEEQSLADVSYLAQDIHVYPDFHGNRSPLADPSMTGMISGLTLDTSERNLALLYLATLQSLAYGTRHIIEQLSSFGHAISSVLMCGGLSKSQLFIRIHANALGIPVFIPNTKQSVLLGSSMLGAAASSKEFPDLISAAVAMGGSAEAFEPVKELKRFHDGKYAVFFKMQKNQLEYQSIMKQSQTCN